MMRAYLGLGTNIGKKENNLRLAVKHIEERVGKIVSLSAFYHTQPWGFQSDNTFLNAALCVDTPLSPQELLAITQSIEQDMGRTHKSANGVYADRLIDIDLLLCGDMIIDTPTLTIPHPLMQERRFVMEPLAEIAPSVVHPLLNKRLEELAAHATY